MCVGVCVCVCVYIDPFDAWQKNSEKKWMKMIHHFIVSLSGYITPGHRTLFTRKRLLHSHFIESEENENDNNNQTISLYLTNLDGSLDRITFLRN